MKPLPTALPATMQRLDAILGTYGELAKARALPAAMRGDVGKLRLSSDATYGSAPHADAIALARAVLAETADRREREGIALRDQALAALAAEVEAIRADICNQAARYAVELGAIARNMRND